MEFALSDRVEQLRGSAEAFLRDEVLPAERVLEEQVAGATDALAFEPPIREELKAKARKLGLWNLFLPDPEWGADLTNVEYATIAEVTGWSPDLAPEAMNCNPPDTGNMELLALFGTQAQQQRWLVPLLEGQIRSCFSMTEPAVASSDANNIATTAVRDRDEYVINGRKWWTSGVLRDSCELIIVMAVTEPDAPQHHRHTMLLVPRDTPGVTIVRPTSVFGYLHGGTGGHAEIIYDNVRVPADSVLGSPGEGFAAAQARLGPGRIHHCMRLLGEAERAVELMCQRALHREAFGKPLAEQGVVQQQIADSRIEIESARLLVLKTAWLMDTAGNKGARTEISAIKALVPQMAQTIIDRAIQVHGGAGVSEDLPLARFLTDARYLRIGDGPDEVHKTSIARRELRKHQQR